MHDRSGLKLAEQAHDAGVVEPTEVLPNQLVLVEFVIRGTAEHADHVATLLALGLTDRDDVKTVVFSVKERQ